MVYRNSAVLERVNNETQSPLIRFILEIVTALENTNCMFNRNSQAGQVPVVLLLIPAQYSIARSLERRDGNTVSASASRN